MSLRRYALCYLLKQRHFFKLLGKPAKSVTAALLSKWRPERGTRIIFAPFFHWKLA